MRAASGSATRTVPPRSAGLARAAHRSGRRGRNADRHAHDLAPVVEDVHAGGYTRLGAIADEFNARGMLTRRGRRWHKSTVMNLLGRLAGWSLCYAYDGRPGDALSLRPVAAGSTMALDHSRRGRGDGRHLGNLRPFHLVRRIVRIVRCHLRIARHQTRRNTTTGRPRPLGQRGAVMADTVGQAYGAPSSSTSSEPRQKGHANEFVSFGRLALLGFLWWLQRRKGRRYSG